jgi:hypothetical protein
LFFSTRASAVAYANGACICFNQALSAALLAKRELRADQLLISAERNRESEV